MKKNNYLLVFLLSVFSITSFAQTLTLTKKHANTVIHNNDTIIWRFNNDHVGHDWADSLIVSNVTGHVVGVWCKKTERRLVYGIGNDFCWGLCVDSTTYQLGPLDITANSFNDEFSAHYRPNGLEGISVIRYTFYKDGNPSDSICFNLMCIHPPTIGVKEIYKNFIFTNAYPNPANNLASIEYSYSTEVGNAKIIVSDLLGKVVKEMPLSGYQGKVSINTADMQNGIYMYALQLNGRTVVTRKLMVNH